MVNFVEFVARYRIHRFSKGEVIVYQDETPDVVYCVRRGVVKTYNITSQGEEKPISFSRKHEIFPVGWAFAQIDKAQYYYEAMTDTEVYAIPRPDYLEFLRNNPHVGFTALQTFARQHIAHQMLINALEQSKAADKILHTLHFLVYSFGETTKTGLTRVGIPMTQQNLANFMGLARETTSIELKKLERKNVVSYERPHYIVDISLLKQRLGQDDDNTKLFMPEYTTTALYTA